MSLGNHKLFEVRVKGVKHGNFARNSSPGTIYVVSKSMDKAYNAIMLLYGNDPNYADCVGDFALDEIRLVADESNPNTCESETYKLMMADDFFDKFSSKDKIDIDAIKKFVEEENKLNDSEEDADGEELDDEGYPKPAE